MKKLVLKLLCAALSLLILSSCMLTGCSDPGGNEPEESPEFSSKGDKTEESENATADLSDDLPERDFGKEQFIVVTADDTIDYVDVEKGDTGNLIEDTAYARDRTVEERFNI